jgi:hypothetical protein
MDSKLYRTISFYNSIKNKTISIENFKTALNLSLFLAETSEIYKKHLLENTNDPSLKEKLNKIEPNQFERKNKQILKNPETKLGLTFPMDYFTYFVKDDLDVNISTL